MSTTVSVGDAGPIKFQSLDLIPGNIMLLRGGSETGKTKFMDGLDHALGGKHAITKRVGAASPGFVKITEGGVDEVTLTIGASRISRSGTSQIRGIAGRLDIYDIVEPRQIGALAADKTRTEALVRLTGVKVSAAMFAPLVGGMERLAELLPLDAKLAGDDPVGYQRWVKAGLEEAKRTAEKESAAAKSRAATCAQMVGDIDLDAECGAQSLNIAQEAAIRRRDRLGHDAEVAEESAKNVAAAQEAAEAALAAYKGPTADEAFKDLEAAGTTLSAAGTAYARHAAALKTADENQRAAEAAYKAKEEASKAAESHAATIKSWQKTIDDGKVDGPSDEQIIDAENEVTHAREAVELGSEVRRARKSKAEQSVAELEARTKQREADELREAAKGTEQVLADAVHADGLELRDGRWITQVDGREVFFAERSRGARASIAIELVCNQVVKLGGNRAVIPYDQTLWQEMDGDARRRLWRRCRELSEPDDFSLTIVTAQVDTGKTGPLRWEVYVPEAEAEVEDGEEQAAQ